MRKETNEGANCVHIFVKFGVSIDEVILNILKAQQVDIKGIGS